MLGNSEDAHQAAVTTPPTTTTITDTSSSPPPDAEMEEGARALLQHLPGHNILVTGGCGFIGSCFIRCLLQWGPRDVRVCNLDNMEYCAGAEVPFLTPMHAGEAAVGEKEEEKFAADSSSEAMRYTFVKGSILDADLIAATLRTHKIDVVVHMAAQTHVDNSFANSLSFTQVNVVGTHTLLECARAYGHLTRFLHISTDEVYGETMDPHSAATEEGTVLRPTNPYAATKAAAEHLALAYFSSFHLPVVVSRGNNVYGPGQYPEKVIPRFITECLRGQRLPIHGDGHNKRSFMYVEDVVRGLLTVLIRGDLGTAYNVASAKEWSVCDVARRVVACVTRSHAEGHRADFDDVYVRYVEDRAYNDARYFISCDRLTALGWRPLVSFEEGLQRTVEWYRAHPLDGGYWKGVAAAAEEKDQKADEAAAAA